MGLQMMETLENDTAVGSGVLFSPSDLLHCMATCHRLDYLDNLVGVGGQGGNKERKNRAVNGDFGQRYPVM